MRDTALISVIVTTYNREDALDAALRALAQQSDRNFEVIIADDGSRPDTAHIVESWKARLTLPLRHVRHEHMGFRGGEIRNRGIAASTGEICIFLDGDCLAPADFIAVHRRLSEPGWFVTGNRILLSPELTSTVLARGVEAEKWNLTALLQQRLTGGINRLLPTLRLPLGPLRKLSSESWQGAQTCNLAVARADLDRIDGFDCDYTGWGLGGFRPRGAPPSRRRTAQGWPVRDRRLAFVASAERPLAIAGEPGQARRGHRRRSRARLARPFRVERRDAHTRATMPDGSTMTPLQLPENPRVLVITLRRLGDVLLTTPLIRSVKRAFPQASIDALVFAGTEGILTGNPDLQRSSRCRSVRAPATRSL